MRGEQLPEGPHDCQQPLAPLGVMERGGGGAGCTGLSPLGGGGGGVVLTGGGGGGGGGTPPSTGDDGAKGTARPSLL
jgi:hypothetical protein